MSTEYRYRRLEGPWCKTFKKAWKGPGKACYVMRITVEDLEAGRLKNVEWSCNRIGWEPEAYLADSRYVHWVEDGTLGFKRQARER